jgi:hypothetical protein
LAGSSTGEVEQAPIGQSSVNPRRTDRVSDVAEASFTVASLRRSVCSAEFDLEGMGAIDTEDAARRLARVILADIDLYMRERPKLGESREAQIEEGRRLFASRVTPALVPVFAKVLADRAVGRVNAPTPSIPASGPAATVGPVHSPPTSHSATDEETATDPSIFVPPLEDQAPPAPAIAARAVVDPPRALAASAATEAPAAVVRARYVAPPAPEIPTLVPPSPVPTARVSIPRLLAIASVVAAIVAVFRLFLR